MSVNSDRAPWERPPW